MQPLVSCILPTRNRAACIRLAISSYLSQTYQNKELIVVDNGDDGTEGLIPCMLGIRYHHVDGKRTTGEMRNLCNEMASGDIICHFDSDDWSASDRVSDQVERLGEGVLTGYSDMLFYDERDEKCYRWSRPRIPFILGTSFCYRRSWWKSHPFDSLMVGEDFRFFKYAMKVDSSKVTYVSSGMKMVALVHDDQTSRKSLKPPLYVILRKDMLPKEFYEVQYNKQFDERSWSAKKL